MARIYHKHNKVDSIELITPKFYLEDDIAASGLHLDIVDQVLSNHIQFANVISSIIPLSSTTLYPGMDGLSGISRFFVKQNSHSQVSPFSFLKYFMADDSVLYSDFETSGAFKTYLENTFIPRIQQSLLTEAERTTAYSQLGWFYILVNATDGTFSPSGYVSDKLTELYFGKNLDLIDGMNGVTKLLWYDNVSYIPESFVSGTTTYTSGTQSLSALETVNSILYSQGLDSENTYIQDAFELYLGTGALPQSEESAGPFYRFLKALSYSLFDIDEPMEGIGDLYDIRKCPDQFLPYLAQLIGWQLMGHDPDRWRLQLLNAVDIYKAKGTKRGIQIAADSVTQEGSLSLSSLIVEFYESYIPNILFYALATEAMIFSSFGSYTQNKADTIGVSSYSHTSMDTNLRYVVDYILLKATEKYPELFFIKGEPFCFDSSTFVFNYRDRDFSIPPFEQFKYYKDCHLTAELIKFFMNELACLGVPASFTTSAENYILQNTVSATAEAQIHNKWLFFTLAQEKAPNYTSILGDLTKGKATYLSLWSGKSSHFDLTFNASDFTFSPYSLEASASQGFHESLRLLDRFIPAHAIPLTNLNLGERDYLFFSSLPQETITSRSMECLDTSTSLANFEISGVDMTAGSSIFTRHSANLLMSGTDVLTTGINRNSFRRRNYKHLLPKNDFMVRDGFSMPAPNQHVYAALQAESYMPLGFVASTLSFVAIDNYTALPEVWRECENLNSSSVFNGVASSATAPVRGWSNLSALEEHEYVTRGGLDPIVQTIYSTLLDRTMTTSVNPAGDVVSSFNLSASPSSFHEYEDFEFKEGIHRLFADYIKVFGKHPLPGNLVSSIGGFNILTHTYGPTMYNGGLNKAGSATSNVTTSLDNVQILTKEGTSVNDYEQYLNIQISEFRDPHTVSGVELVTPTASPGTFIYYKLDNSQTKPGFENYGINNGLIKVSPGGFDRIRFDLSAYGDAPNYLIPGQSYSTKIKYLMAEEGTNKLGGGKVGVWIHTMPEDGKVWSWANEKKWVVHDSSSLFYNPETIKLDLAHYGSQPVSYYKPEKQESLPCIENPNGPSPFNIDSISESMFTEFEVKFDTHNFPIKTPQSYYINHPQVHRTNQRYVVEVFRTPTSNKKLYALFDRVSIINLTQAERAEEFTPVELLRILKWFNNLSNEENNNLGWASRSAAITSGCFEESGGSRLNYRIHPDWVQVGALTAYNQYQELDFKD